MRVLVTGASSGIGEATVRTLIAEGHEVIATARRRERLERLREQTGADVFPADLTLEKDVAALVAYAGEVDALVNNAGGARGADCVAEGNLADWQAMYELNVLATLRLTQALLPQLRRSAGTIVFITSTAAHETYIGGAGYMAAKHAEAMIPQTLRLELLGENVRLIEICPGMVKTEEFSLNRLGSVAAAEQVYSGVDEPLLAEDIAEVIAFALSRPQHVNLDRIVVRPLAQAHSSAVARTGTSTGSLPPSQLT